MWIEGSLFCTSPTTTRLVLVPISEHVPPRIVAQLSGIISREADTPMRFDQSLTIGTIAATSGVLLMNAEIAADGTMRRSCAPITVRGRPRTRRTKKSSAPVSRIAAATTNSTPTVSMPSFANPANASLLLRMPHESSSTTPPSNVTSGPARFRTIT